MIYQLRNLNLGWAKNIVKKLEEYNLEQDWEIIRTLTKQSWRTSVKTAVQNKNKQKLMDHCIEKTPHGDKIKTKTAYIYEKLKNSSYTFEPLPELLSSNKIETKTILLSRCGMLMCGVNFKATIPAVCMECQVIDNEDHRLNHCHKWQDINFVNNDINANFLDVFSEDKQKLSTIVHSIQKVWELKLGNGSMKKPT